MSEERKFIIRESLLQATVDYIARPHKELLSLLSGLQNLSELDCSNDKTEKAESQKLAEKVAVKKV